MAGISDRLVSPIRIKISFPGGIVGLFTGMSVLSAFEVGYWLFKSIHALTCGMARKNRVVQKSDEDCVEAGGHPAQLSGQNSEL